MQSTYLRSLKKEPRHTLRTSEAARHLSLKPQTLRAWAHYKTGPITPISERIARALFRLEIELKH